MKKTILFLSLLFVTSCGENSYEKIVPTRNEEKFTMSVVFKPESKIQEFCSNLGVNYHANGCAEFNLETKHCTIYVMEPRYVEDQERMAILGHETLHCKYGKYHK